MTTSAKIAWCLAAVLLVLAYKLNKQDQAIAGLKRQQLSFEKKESLPVPFSLELQSTCARQAGSEFRANFSSEKMAGYENHYSTRYGRCFVVISNTTATKESISTSQILSDAFEGRHTALIFG